jgi:hypothetical protein
MGGVWYSRRAIYSFEISETKEVVEKKVRRVVKNFSLDLRRGYLVEITDIKIES